MRISLVVLAFVRCITSVGPAHRAVLLHGLRHRAPLGVGPEEVLARHPVAAVEVHALGLADLVVEDFEHGGLQAMREQCFQRAQGQFTARACFKTKGQVGARGRHLLVEPLGIPQGFQVGNAQFGSPALRFIGVVRSQVLVGQLGRLELDGVFKEEMEGVGVLGHGSAIRVFALKCTDCSGFNRALPSPACPLRYPALVDTPSTTHTQVAIQLIASSALTARLNGESCV